MDSSREVTNMEKINGIFTIVGHLAFLGGLVSYLVSKYVLDMPEVLVGCVFVMSCGIMMVVSGKNRIS